MTNPIPKKAKHGIIMGLPVLCQNKHIWLIQNMASQSIEYWSWFCLSGHKSWPSLATEAPLATDLADFPEPGMSGVDRSQRGVVWKGTTGIDGLDNLPLAVLGTPIFWFFGHPGIYIPRISSFATWIGLSISIYLHLYLPLYLYGSIYSIYLRMTIYNHRSWNYYTILYINILLYYIIMYYKML